MNNRDFLEINRSQIVALSDDISSGKFAIHDATNHDLFPKAREYSKELEKAVGRDDEDEITKALVDLLYLFRNARIHGQWATGRTYFAPLPRSMYELCIHLLSGKTQHGVDTIVELVELRHKRLVDEIKSNISSFGT